MISIRKKTISDQKMTAAGRFLKSFMISMELFFQKGVSWDGKENGAQGKYKTDDPHYDDRFYRAFYGERPESVGSFDVRVFFSRRSEHRMGRDILFSVIYGPADPAGKTGGPSGQKAHVCDRDSDIRRFFPSLRSKKSA